MKVKVKRYERYVICLVKEIEVDLDSLNVDDLDIFFAMEPDYIKVDDKDIEIDALDGDYEHLGWTDFVVDGESIYKVNEETLETSDYSFSDYPLMSPDEIKRDKKISEIFKK